MKSAERGRHVHRAKGVHDKVDGQPSFLVGLAQ
jgi:hypothetical protein